MKEAKVCKTLKKEEVVWDSISNKITGGILDTLCDLTGKGCKLADEFKEEHTFKSEKRIEICEWTSPQICGNLFPTL